MSTKSIWQALQPQQFGQTCSNAVMIIVLHTYLNSCLRNRLPYILFGLLVLVPSLHLVAHEGAPRALPKRYHAFIENRGQLRDTQGKPRSDIRYYADLGCGSVYLRNGVISYVVRSGRPASTNADDGRTRWQKRNDPTGPTGFYRFDVEFLGANSVTATELSPNEEFINFYQGKGQKPILAVPTAKSILYKNLYRGIDLHMSVSAEGLKLTWQIAAGADPTQIRYRLVGADVPKLLADGSIQTLLPIGGWAESAPVAWQTATKAQQAPVPVEVGYRVEKGIVSLGIGTYDKTKPLIIDPLNRVWATYMGGTEDDRAWGTTLTNSGDIYVCGSSYSNNFPVDPGTFQDFFIGRGGNCDAFLTKIAMSGTRVWSTYIGGEGNELAYGLETDLKDNPVVCGRTTSVNFPTTPGAFQEKYGGKWDGFICTFDGSGQQVWTTFFGGESEDEAIDMGVDNNGFIAITGFTDSRKFFITPNCFQKTKWEGRDAYLAKFTPEGKILWSTLFGGKGEDAGLNLAVDKANNILITGSTSSADEFPITDFAFQPIYGGGNPDVGDMYIAKFNPTGIRQWCTYFGGDEDEQGIGIAVNGEGLSFVVGFSRSQGFPMTDGAFQNRIKGLSDIVFVVLNKDGKPIYTTYIGGRGNEYGYNVALDSQGNIHLTGSTGGDDFPTTAEATQKANAGLLDAVLVSFNKEYKLYYSSYIGGSREDEGVSASADDKGNVLIAGRTQSYDFPLSSTAQQPKNRGSYDAFILMLGELDCNLFSIKPIITPPSCGGAPDGAIAVRINNGVPPYTYLWSNGAKTESISNLEPARYSVKVSDSRGCQANLSVTLSLPSALSIALEGGVFGCDGKMTGPLVAKVTGGKLPYTYKWAHGPATASLIGLEPGSYTVTVTDSSGCRVSKTITLLKREGLTADYNIVKPKCVSGSKGDAMVIPKGGTPPYVITWSNGTVGAQAKSLNAGPYSVTIVDSLGCKKTVNILMVQPEPITVTAIVKQSGCEGGGTSSIKLVVKGGVPPYTYQWSNRATTKDLQGIPAGLYAVIVTDSTSCTATTQAAILDVKAPIVTLNIAQPNCNTPLGGAIAIIAGGSPPYRISWSTGATGDKISGVRSGEYFVEVVDSSGCRVKQPFIIQNLEGLKAVASFNLISCEKANVALQVSGGKPPYKYLWNNGAVTQSLTGVPPGNYSVTVMDSLGCKIAQNVNILTAQSLVVSIKAAEKGCGAEAGADLTASVTGGKKPYTFYWNNETTTSAIIGAKAGEYTLTVTDSMGCKATQKYTVRAGSNLFVELKAKEKGCGEQATGDIDVAYSGGRKPYFFKWSNGATTAPLRGVKAGTYTLVVTDSVGCKGEKTIEIRGSGAMDVVLKNNPTGCGLDFAFLSEAVVTGGRKPYTYKWSNGTTTVSAKLPAGGHSVMITDSLGCSVTKTLNVPSVQALVIAFKTAEKGCGGEAGADVSPRVTGGYPPYKFSWSDGSTNPILASAKAGEYTLTITDSLGCIASQKLSIKPGQALNLTLNVTEKGCGEQALGDVEAVVKGGRKPYKYSWSSGATTQIVRGLKAGGYTLTVTDSLGCSAAQSVDIRGGSALVVTIKNALSGCGANYAMQSDIVVEGGRKPYTFKWSNGTTSANAKLPVGNYTVVVSDSLGCVVTKNVTVPAMTPLALNFKTATKGCGDEAGADITPRVTGGITPYKYAWSDGSTSPSLVAAKAGDYNLTVTDSLGCTVNQKLSVKPGQAISLNLKVVEKGCGEQTLGDIEAVLTGGRKPFVYKWSNGATTPSLKAQRPGTYTLTISDSVGCTAERTVTIRGNAPLSVSFKTSVSGCGVAFALQATALVEGGKKPYSYKWSNGLNTATATVPAGNNTLTVTDSMGCTVTKTLNLPAVPQLSLSYKIAEKGCTGGGGADITTMVKGGKAPYTYSWSDGSKGTSLLNAKAGDYLVVVTDSLQCSVTQKVIVKEGQAPVITLKTNERGCGETASGDIEASITGGRKPYSYKWSNGATSPSIRGVKTGAYTLTVTDSLGCSTDQKVEIRGGSPLLVTRKTTVTGCGTDARINLRLEVTGGKPPYRYKWSNGLSRNEGIGLSNGTYTIIVSDSIGCENKVTASFDGLQKLAVSILNNPVKCGESTGSMTASVRGGVPPYAFKWSSGETTAGVSNPKSGSYNLTVTDSMGCSTTVNHTFNSPSPLKLELKAIQAGCEAGQKAGAIPTVTGGKPPYKYAWNNNQTTARLEVTQSGTYRLTVTDSMGCTASGEVALTQTAPLQGKLVGRSVSCYGQKNGGASAEILGGTPPYTISWTNGSVQGTISDISEAELNNLPPGLYTVTIGDSRGCKVKDTLRIGEPRQPTLNISATSNKICSGDSTELDAGPGFATYKWSNGKTSRYIQVRSAGDYSCTVRTAEGCEYKLEAVSVTTGTAPAKPSVSFDGDRLVTTAATSYQWYLNGNPIPGAKGAKFAPSEAGKYVVRVFNASGCYAASDPYNFSPRKTLEGVDVRIYPNPNRGAFNLNISKVGESLTVQVINFEGTTILNKVLPKTNAAYTEWVDLKSPPRGQYLIRIRGAEGEIYNTIRVQ
jgi:hypothetical protein